MSDGSYPHTYYFADYRVSWDSPQAGQNFLQAKEHGMTLSKPDR